MKEKRNIQKENYHLTEEDVRIGVLNVTIPYTISNTGATSIAGLQGVPIIITNENSSKTFHLPNVKTSQATKVEKLEHKVLEPASAVDMVPGLVQHILLSSRNLLILTTYQSRMEMKWTHMMDEPPR